MSTILVVDDNRSVREALCQILQEIGHRVEEAEDDSEALESVHSGDFDIVITDLEMPGLHGLSLLQEIQRSHPDIHVVVITAFGTVETAVQAMKAGAYDYLTKPFSMDEIEIVVQRISERQALLAESRYLREQLEKECGGLDALMGSPCLEELREAIAKAAPTNAAVLIRGESGTGKELVARALHCRSLRRDRPLVKVSCAALPEMLLESELFGHERGAFTGAVGRKRGRFELADGGTLFLDEIGDMSLSTQVKLLRVLQESEFERIGGRETVRVDVRMVATTNRDIEDAISRGLFREDLYYRLNVVPIMVPPLRERRGDILALARHFLKRVNRETSKDVLGFSQSALELMEEYDWPGNMRELENAVQRAVVMLSGSQIIESRHLRLTPARAESRAERVPEEAGGIRCALGQIERRALIDVLEKNGWVLTRAAVALGLKRSSLRYRMKKFSCMRDRNRLAAALDVECGIRAPGSDMVRAGRTQTRDISSGGMRLRWLRSWSRHGCELCFEWLFDHNCDKVVCPYRSNGDAVADLHEFVFEGRLELALRAKAGTVRGEVAWVAPAAEDDSYDVGVHFVDVARPFQQEISRYLVEVEAGLER